MITAAQARAIAAERNYEKQIKMVAERGGYQTTLVFANEDMAKEAKAVLLAEPNNFSCTKITAHYGRDGTDYSFEAKWA